jgi:uncharacterized protein YuzE
MKLHYYPDTDSLYIELRPEPGAETREVAEGLNVDVDSRGNVVGFDIDQASKRLDLTSLETVALPLRTTRLVA